MVEQALYYESMYNMQECIMRIIEEPQRYSCKWGTELWYKAEKISDTQIWITFTGGQFRKNDEDSIPNGISSRRRTYINCPAIPKRVIWFTANDTSFGY